MKHNKIILASFLFVSGCTNAAIAKQTLEGEGYTEITITGYNAFTCSESDTFSAGFEAKNLKGILVEGTVCSGLFKGATIRGVKVKK